MVNGRNGKGEEKMQSGPSAGCEECDSIPTTLLCCFYFWQKSVAARKLLASIIFWL